MISILLLIDDSKESERRLLRGLVSYANSNGGCMFYSMSSFRLESKGHSKEILSAAHSLNVDAVFGIWADPTEEDIKSLGKPVILRTLDKDYDFLPMLSGHYERIGEMAAEFYAGQRYSSVAFIGFKDTLWSDLRYEGFHERTKRAGIMTDKLLIDIDDIDRNRIAGWIRELPKPVGIFACNDMVARVVSEVCLFNGIPVPSDVAILGADDDDFLCNISYPTLSSINLDFEKQGYQLGEAIFRMVEEGRTWPIRIPISPVSISQRGSTMHKGAIDKYVQTVLEFMDSHYSEPISISDVCEQVPLSRRALELRFKREMQPQTMNSYLSGLRVKRMSMLLMTTEMSVNAAAAASGFSDPSNVGRVFRKITGVSPSSFRKRRQA